MRTHMIIPKEEFDLEEASKHLWGTTRLRTIHKEFPQNVTRYIKDHPLWFPTPYQVINGHHRVWLTCQLSTYGLVDKDEGASRFTVPYLHEKFLRLGSYKDLTIYHDISEWGVKEGVYRGRIPRPHALIGKIPVWWMEGWIPLDKEVEANVPD